MNKWQQSLIYIQIKTIKVLFEVKEIKKIVSTKLFL